MNNSASFPRPLTTLLAGRLRRRAADRTDLAAPRWHRWSLLALLAATAVLYIWGLGASGWANGFYAAAVEAGTKSWKAFLFGSFDSSNFITVDKPPASLWVMELSARVFGVNSWSMLVPQALEGVAAVGLLYAAVRRAFGQWAGLLAGATLALTPVAALMFRFNNPDALLVLLLVGAAYATLRAVQSGRTSLLVLAGTLVGFGFLTKMLQAFIVLPVFPLTYLVAGPTRLRRRLLQVAYAGVAVIASAGWWVAVVTLWPASDRPYIGGSTDNSILNLVFGYNGFGRITGTETGSVGTSGTAGSWGITGLLRMFDSDFGTQISWLIPAALLLMIGIFVALRRAPRSNLMRANAILWGGWLILTAIVFSLAQGIIHPYYSVALAPAIAALVGGGGTLLWHMRHAFAARLFLIAAVAATTVWAVVLLGRSPTWLPWLTPVLVLGGVFAVIGLLFADRLQRGLLIGLAGLVVAVALAAPLTYSIDTAATTHSGSLPLAGPAVAGANAFGNGGPGNGAGGPGGNGGAPTRAFAPRQGFGGGNGGPPAFGGTAPGGGFGGPPVGGTGAATAGPGGPGGAGGLLNASTPSAVVTAALQADASTYTWVLAAVGANNAAGYQLAADEPVMAIGGFNGTDNAPTLAQFETYVDKGEIHYFLASGGGGVGGSSSSSAITSWVESHFATVTIGGTTFYDLTEAAG